MHAITPLIAGISSAANGRAEIYKGIDGTTSSRAVHYTSFAGDGGSTQNIELDGSGGATRYINELVTVKVYDSNGGLVRTFTDGADSPNVEVKSLSFTGNNYETGVAATNEPTTLQAVLDTWLTNSGAPDWKVKFGDITKTLSNWVGEFSATIYNVKDPAYGAVGNGTTDDISAINAAITAAANAGGGIVFFPPGTYRTTTVISVGVDVSLVGSGPNSSIIKMDDAANPTINVANNANIDKLYQTIHGLGFEAAVANSDDTISVQGVHLIISNCSFGKQGNLQGVHIADSGVSSIGRVVIRDCRLYMNDSTDVGIFLSSVNMEKYVDNCEFIFPATFNSYGIQATGISVTNSRFDNSGITTGTVVDIYLEDGESSFVHGCTFTEVDTAGTANCTGIEIASVSSDMHFTESSNSFIAGGLGAITPYTIATAARTRSRFFTREIAEAETVDNSATVNLSTDQFGVILLEKTSGSTATVVLEAGILGAFATIVLYNNGTGGNVTFTIDSTNAKAASTIVVANNMKAVVRFVSVTGSIGTPIWFQIGTPQDVSP